MKHMVPRVLGGLVLALLLVGSSFAGESRFETMLKHAKAGDQLTCWVFFTDKGTEPLAKLDRPASLISERAIKRRLNVLPAYQLVDETDLPVEQSYIDQVTALVTKIRHVSKWLNGISVEATPEQLTQVKALPFVKDIQLVARFWNRRSEAVPAQPGLPSGDLKKTMGTDSLNYGPSLGQLQQINVPAVHNTGNSAQGILIAVMDNGFRLLGHQVFDNLRSRIIATHDFVDNKVDVAPNNPNPDFGGHGVMTLSTLAGYRPGQLIGPAYGASFILARTENDSASDFYPSEEDNWIAAAEWAESLGVQVTSTSLGYLEHVKTDSPWVVDTATSWKWYDMDGKIIPISRAATLAARKGVVVCNSAGNDALRGDPNTLDAPADADSILTVGAVTPNGTIAYFSSYGPTVDGRIKPDVVAQGTSDYVASPVDTTAYSYAQGTSFSCPLVAGSAALILKAHPTAKPMEVIRALKATANNAAAPNNHYGWGIIDVMAAINYLNPPSSVPKHSPLQTVIRGNSIEFTLPEPSEVTLKVYNILGQEVKTLLSNAQTAMTSAVNWDATNYSGSRVASGVYFFRLEAKGISGNNYFAANKMLILR